MGETPLRPLYFQSDGRCAAQRRGKRKKKLRPSLVVFCFSSFTGFFLLLLFALPLLVWFLSSDGYLSVDARSSREKRARERERERGGGAPLRVGGKRKKGEEENILSLLFISF